MYLEPGEIEKYLEGQRTVEEIGDALQVTWTNKNSCFIDSFWTFVGTTAIEYDLTDTAESVACEIMRSFK